MKSDKATFQSPTKFIHENVNEITVLSTCSGLDEYKKKVGLRVDNNVGIINNIIQDNDEFRVDNTPGLA
jgi:hypothetical protein